MFIYVFVFLFSLFSHKPSPPPATPMMLQDSSLSYCSSRYERLFHRLRHHSSRLWQGTDYIRCLCLFLLLGYLLLVYYGIGNAIKFDVLRI